MQKRRPLLLALALFICITLAGAGTLAFLRTTLLGLPEKPTSLPGLQKIPGDVVAGAESSPIVVNG